MSAKADPRDPPDVDLGWLPKDDQPAPDEEVNPAADEIAKTQIVKTLKPADPDTIMGRVEAEAIRILAGDADAFTRGGEALIRAYMGKHGLKHAERILAEEQPDLDPTKSIGTRTVGDLATGPHPPQLLPPFLHPTASTFLYGPGGVGKGMIACLFALELVRAGHIVMLLDFENHDDEWGRRIRGMGATDEEVARIHYRAPFGDDWTAPAGSIRDVAPYIRADADALGVTYLIVDSFTASTSGGDSMGGKADAEEYFHGLKRIGRASLTVAHVTGAAQRFPAKPYGSVFVHNYARETWAVESLADDDQPSYEEYAPSTINLELRNKKMNTGEHPEPQFVSFAFFADSHIEFSTQKPKKGSIADWGVDILTRAKRPMDTKAIVKAIKDDNGEIVLENSLRVALHRDKRVTESTGVPRLWDLLARTQDD